MDDNWRLVLTALVSAVPAAIAAVSSLRNGARINDAKKKLEEMSPPVADVSAESTQPVRDWYSPIDLFDD